VTKANKGNAEPRWPAELAVLAVGALNFALPEAMSPGPGWGLLAVVVGLAVPLIITHRAGRHHLNQKLGITLLTIVTGALVYALVQLVSGLLSRTASANEMLRGAAILWSSNILIFAAWYWRLDAGGPHLRGKHAHAFLFPQATLGQADWKPHFVDYLFLAFNTSTALSPTDSPVLSRWAKGLMMVQASISLTSLAVVAARAVNII
jgi:hypothetical protein